MGELSGKRVLIMATDGFEESELFGPLAILKGRGAEVLLASPLRSPIQATVMDDPGKVIRPDLLVSDARAEDFDALLLPGGVRNPDTLRLHAPAITLIRQFHAAGKPIGAICCAEGARRAGPLLRPTFAMPAPRSLMKPP